VSGSGIVPIITRVATRGKPDQNEAKGFARLITFWNFSSRDKGGNELYLFLSGTFGKKNQGYRKLGTEKSWDRKFQFTFFFCN
jgi:hypothetical protein